HEVDVHREQNKLDRHQDDDDVLAVEKNAEDPKREKDRGDPKIMPQPDHESPCPDFTLTISIAVERRRATCSVIDWRLTPGLCCSVITMAPIMAPSRMRTA